MDNIKFIAHIVVQIHWFVFRLAEMENDGMSVADWFAQVQDEHSGRVGDCVGNGQIVGGNRDPRDGQLLLGIGVLYEDSSREGYRLLDAPSNHGEGGSGEQDRYNQSNPQLNFVSTSHRAQQN